MVTRADIVILLSVFLCACRVERAFGFIKVSTRPAKTVRLTSPAVELSAEGFGGVKERPTQEKDLTMADNLEIKELTADEAKRELVDLISRIQGSEEEYRAIQDYVNFLEAKYVAVQTLDFLNMAIAGDWQLLFSTNLLGRPARRLRLREMIQRVEPNKLNGTLTNIASWDYAETGEQFDSSGNFSSVCTYSINQGARMVVDLSDHELRPAKGSSIPSDVPGLVGLLHRAMPKELFDPSAHALDTTYLDADIRIVRLTGPRHEGVRNIFIRKGSIEIQPLL